jgi:cell fate regulator YaaT (PSP1 superfamily)
MNYSVLARYGAMRSIGTFSSTIKNLRLGDKVILHSSRGTEWGEVLSSQRIDTDRPKGKVEGAILRRVTREDYQQRQSIEENNEPKEFAFCVAKIAEHKLPMRVVKAEHIFGGEKVIFFFLAEGRVDFRELVKDLANEYHTRIEMRQIGVRDEARLLAEYEHCGQELCCRTFIKDLEPVTMRMAKHQKTTLDPSKISGRCGRLMCCLRYEDATYAELKKNLPKKGTQVWGHEVHGEVVSGEILAQTVTIETPDRRYVKVPLDEISFSPPEEKPSEEASGSDDSPTESGDDDASRRPKRRPSQRRKAQDAEAPVKEASKAEETPSTPPSEGGGSRRSRSRRSRRSRGRRNRDQQPRQEQQEPKPERSADQESPKPEEPKPKNTPPSPDTKKANDFAPDEWWENQE